MWFADTSKLRVPTADEALGGRAERIEPPASHFVFETPMEADFTGCQTATFGMGCFWGAEKKFWQLPGVVNTAVGYAGGHTPNPTYREVCSGQTGHTEVVRVVFDPLRVDYAALLRVFWENHDPTQHMRQGNDIGTQYRSAIYSHGADQMQLANASRDAFQRALSERGFGAICTEIAPAGAFYFAEAYHQQYLAKNPDGYCGLGGTGVACPVGVGARIA